MNESRGLHAFIVDDNAQAMQTLATDLEARSEIASVRCFSSYAEATLPLLEVQPDVLFLDVEVPGKMGIEFLESIRPKVNFTFKVVFYTAYSSYMLDAIRQSAFDFLLKPYKQSELDTIIARIVEETANKRGAKAQIYGEPHHRIAMQTVSELLLVSADQALMFTYMSDHRAWQITLTDGTSHLLKKGLTADELLSLHPALARISNTCIINLTYLAAVENNTQHCRFFPPHDKIDLTVSRRYFGKLKERFEML